MFSHYDRQKLGGWFSGRFVYSKYKPRASVTKYIDSPAAQFVPSLAWHEGLCKRLDGSTDWNLKGKTLWASQSIQNGSCLTILTQPASGTKSALHINTQLSRPTIFILDWIQCQWIHLHWSQHYKNFECSRGSSYCAPASAGKIQLPKSPIHQNPDGAAWILEASISKEEVTGH